MTRRAPHHTYTDRSDLARPERSNDITRVVRCTRCGVENAYCLPGTKGERWRVPGGAWTSKKIDCTGGKSAPPPTVTAPLAVLVGHFFIVETEEGWQGRVLSAVAPGAYLVQLYSWITGEPTCRRVVAVERMLEWSFYVTESEWHAAGVSRCSSAGRTADRPSAPKPRASATDRPTGRCSS